MVSKWTFLFQGLIFRFHVKFQGCRALLPPKSLSPHLLPWRHPNVEVPPCVHLATWGACRVPATILKLASSIKNLKNISGKKTNIYIYICIFNHIHIKHIILISFQNSLFFWPMILCLSSNSWVETSKKRNNYLDFSHCLCIFMFHHFLLFLHFFPFHHFVCFISFVFFLFMKCWTSHFDYTLKNFVIAT